jgi:hypothetical protein
LNDRDTPVDGPVRENTRFQAIACVLLLSIYFAVFAADGLGAYFTPDDGGNLVNMHEYWEHSLGDMAGSALRVVTAAYRPLGGIYYLALYRLAGFHPLPFRAVCLSLMLANLFLAFALLRRLSGSLEAALLGALLLAHHPALLWLFYSSGTIYEILCFLFYYLALLCYCRWRQEGATTLSWARLALLLVLTACALDSKEMAMTLPAALLLFELTYFPPRWRSWPDVARFAVRQGRGAWAAALLTALVIAAKLSTANPLSNDPRYHVHSFRSVIEAMRGYQAALLYLDLYRGEVSTAGLLLLWTAMAALAFAFRSRPMKFGLCLTIATLAPLSVIEPRGGYMLYLPLMGWALFLGSFLAELCHRLAGVAAPSGLGVAWRRACLILAAAAIVGGHARLRAPRIPGIHLEQAEARRIMGQLRELHPRLASDSFLLLENDRLPRGWGLMFFTQLAYANPDIILERTSMMDRPPTPAEMTLYDHVFVDDGVRLRETPVPPRTGAERPLEVRFQPARVRPGDTYRVFLPELAGQTIDVVIRSTRRASYLIVARKWCMLDASGSATFETPELPRQSISVLRVRSQESRWKPASGVIEIAR